MGPIFDVTMLKRLCVPDFGHVISLWHSCFTSLKIWESVAL
jgi:hypothetical protein